MTASEENEQKCKTPAEKRQERVCNVLTLLGLLAVIVVGGWSICSDVEAEVSAETAVAKPQADVNVEQEEVPSAEPQPDYQPATTVRPDSLEVEPVDTLEAEEGLMADSVHIPLDKTTAPSTHEADSAGSVLHHRHAPVVPRDTAARKTHVASEQSL